MTILIFEIKLFLIKKIGIYMNIEDLQFKDKVNVMPEEKPATVFEINVIERTIKYYIDFLNHYNIAPIEIVYPIYLNPWILMDNGFEYVEEGMPSGYYYKDIVIEKDTYLTKIGDKCNDNIFTVHGLQHALREYGHKDLADEFIVNMESVNMCRQVTPEDVDFHQD